MTTKRPLLFIDGYNIFLRSFMVNESMSSTGDLIGGALGFLRTMKNLIVQFKPERVFVCWEQGGGSPRRKKIYPQYKANRTKSKEFVNLYKSNGKINPNADQENKSKQLLLLTKALGHLPVCQLYIQDVEADDIIAWLVKNKFINHDGLKIIASNDKDFYQLLEDPNVRIYNPATKSLVTRETVKENFNLSPRNITLARSVVGDESDNIDGVDGIGLKTIAKRFIELSDDSKDFNVGWLLEKSRELQNASKKPPKCFGDILNNEKVIRRNWDLMYLDSSILASTQISKLNYRIDEFKPLINQLAYLKTFTTENIAITNDIDSIVSELRFLVINN